MQNNPPILEVRDLLKTFGAVVAAKDINVDISKGEVVGIIGANGAGNVFCKYGDRLPCADWKAV